MRWHSKKVVIVGDLHGDTDTFKKILNAYPIEYNTYILLGDNVDRGKNSTELLAMLMANKILHRKSFVMLRGDHESPIETTYPQQFPGELMDKFESRNLLNKVYDELFSQMPVAVVLNKKYFVVHGGIPIDSPSIDELKKLKKAPNPGSNNEIMQMLWNDPSRTAANMGSQRSRTGEIHRFGNSAADKFLERNKLDMIIRGHEHGLGGYDINDKTLTVLSTTAYKDDKPYVVKIDNGKLEILDVSGPTPIVISNNK